MSRLPDSFRVIRLQLAREPGYPEGDAQHGYDLLAPLDDEGRIDGKVFRSAPGACRVRRFRPNEEDAFGHLGHGPGGAWLIDYGSARIPSERAFQFRDERFRPGEYVSIREDGDHPHTFKVASLRRP
jgi:hypothetical protein